MDQEEGWALWGSFPRPTLSQEKANEVFFGFCLLSTEGPDAKNKSQMGTREPRQGSPARERGEPPAPPPPAPSPFHPRGPPGLKSGRGPAPWAGGSPRLTPPPPPCRPPTDRSRGPPAQAGGEDGGPRGSPGAPGPAAAPRPSPSARAPSPGASVRRSVLSVCGPARDRGIRSLEPGAPAPCTPAPAGGDGRSPGRDCRVRPSCCRGVLGPHPRLEEGEKGQPGPGACDPAAGASARTGVGPRALKGAPGAVPSGQEPRARAQSCPLACPGKRTCSWFHVAAREEAAPEAGLAVTS
ncbi:uncharacterized protein LOC141489527 [Macrotis lagotis]|uniref:uncharacterized protein LOC141489527 n=1 Tax=Macrotis lagotis TaxID=92651 RepID=UPI003D69D542